jgi:hypothetical protein
VLRFLAVTTTSHLSPIAAALVNGRFGLRSSFAITPDARVAALLSTSALFSDNVPALSPYAKHSAPAVSTSASDILSLKAAAGILLHPLHQKWDINMETGGLVVVRPDGHVGTLTRAVDASAWMAVEKYFEGFLVL